MILRKTAPRALLVLGAAALLAFVSVSVMMLLAAGRKPRPGATVIVLGAKVNGERPSLILESRINAALAYLRENPGSACVASGGKGPDEGISEAECVKRYLVGRGIDAARIYLEDESRDTRQNIAFSKKIIEARGLNKSVAIATSEFHEFRGIRLAENMGLEAGALPAPTPALLLPLNWLREVGAIFYMAGGVF